MDQLISIANNVQAQMVWNLFELVFLVVTIIVVVRRKVTSQRIALIGFLIFAFAIVFSSFGIDFAAQKLSAIVFILFLISFTLQLILHLKKS